MWKKIYLLIILFSQLLWAGVWQDFNGNFELRVPPGYPPLQTETITEHTPLYGKAVKITASETGGPALFILEGLSVPEEVDTLTFFCRTDTSCDVQIALADRIGITAFVNIKDFLPDKAVTTYWQKAAYPLPAQGINIHDLRRIYVQISPPPDLPLEATENAADNISAGLALPLIESTAAPPLPAKLTLYLDDIILEKAEKSQPGFQIVYNFDSSSQNIFNAEPVIISRNANIALTLETQGHYGAGGKSLQCAFETRENPAEIFFPMRAYHKSNYLNVLKTSFALRSEYLLTLEFLPETTELRQKNKARESYQSKRYQITLRKPDWQKITLPLDNGEDFTGLRITLPANTSGVFYLDDLSLN